MADPTPTEDLLGLRRLKELTLEERVIDPEQNRWAPCTDTIWVKPLRLNRQTGQWANLTSWRLRLHRSGGRESNSRH